MEGEGEVGGLGNGREREERYIRSDGRGRCEEEGPWWGGGGGPW